MVSGMCMVKVWQHKLRLLVKWVGLQVTSRRCAAFFGREKVSDNGLGPSIFSISFSSLLFTCRQRWGKWVFGLTWGTRHIHFHQKSWLHDCGDHAPILLILLILVNPIPKLVDAWTWTFIRGLRWGCMRRHTKIRRRRHQECWPRSRVVLNHFPPQVRACLLIQRAGIEIWKHELNKFLKRSCTTNAWLSCATPLAYLLHLWTCPFSHKVASLSSSIHNPRQVEPEPSQNVCQKVVQFEIIVVHHTAKSNFKLDHVCCSPSTWPKYTTLLQADSSTDLLVFDTVDTTKD